MKSHNVKFILSFYSYLKETPPQLALRSADETGKVITMIIYY